MTAQRGEPAQGQGERQDPSDCGKALTWDDLNDLPTRTNPLGERPAMRAIWLGGVAATVVPTSMHEPGWYVRAANGAGLDGYWSLRSVQDYRLIRQLCDAGAVTAREGDF